MLKRRKPINPKSKKQKELDDLWREITIEKAGDLAVAADRDAYCQWCSRDGIFDFSVNINYFITLCGHHIVSRARGGKYTYENCYITHWLPCHQTITDNNIDVRKYLTRKDWEARVGS